MKAVILAAGLGKRLGGVAKPLVKVGGLEIILRTMKLLSPYVDEFIIVASVYADKIESFLKNKGYSFRVIRNECPEKGNGYSLLLARNYVADRFVLVMGDHVYSKEFVERAIRGVGLIGDREAKFVDVKEATKVAVRNGKVYEIGKHLETFDCVDTGFFVLNSEIFRSAEKLLDRDVIGLSDIVREAQLPVTYVDGLFWMDIDTKDELRKANWYLVKESVKTSGDGFVSRYINRKIYTRISAFVVNKLTPNQLTVISFIAGLVASISVLVDLRLGAILYQLSSILDGCDGEVARASLSESKIGGYIDSILDRFVDFLFLTITALLNPHTLDVAIFAVFGSVMVSYSTEKYKAEYGRSAYADIAALRYLPGKRDERIFLIMILCLLGMVYEMFAAIAALSISRVVATLAIVAKTKS